MNKSIVLSEILIDLLSDFDRQLSIFVSLSKQ